MSKVYPCVYCTEDGHCTKYSDDEATSWCVQLPCEDEKPSNADRIRAMSDEELAELMEDKGDCPPIECPHDGKGAKITRLDCKACWLGWLKSPVKEGEE